MPHLPGPATIVPVHVFRRIVPPFNLKGPDWFARPLLLGEEATQRRFLIRLAKLLGPARVISRTEDKEMQRPDVNVIFELPEPLTVVGTEGRRVAEYLDLGIDLVYLPGDLLQGLVFRTPPRARDCRSFHQRDKA